MDKAIVSIVMGSDSDLPVMQEAAKMLQYFGINYEIIISSAHRLPEKTAQFAEEAHLRGIKVIIAGAGGAAHLAGVIAAQTPLPVIGVPIKSAALSGVDSLYSIVQMPSGIPVATVAINGSKNAAILAVQILAVKDEDLRERIIAYKQQLAEQVERKNDKLQQLGAEEYMAQMR